MSGFWIAIGSLVVILIVLIPISNYRSVQKWNKADHD